MKALFSRWYDKKIDAAGLGLFRIFYFLVFFCEIAQMFYFKELIFDKIPFVDPYEINFKWAFYAWFVCIWCLILGLKTRTMAIVNYAFTLVFISTSFTYQYHIFYIYTTIHFFALFLPLSKRYSLDRLLLKLKHSNTKYQYQPPTTTTVMSYTMLVFVVIGFAYFDSILAKITSKFWMQGLGVWFPAAFPHTTIISSEGLSGLFVNNLFITKFFGYLTLVFEAVFIFVFWFRKPRIILLLIGVGLHIGILITFPIPWFALAMTALYVLLIPVAWYRQLATWYHRKNRTVLTVYYDQECPLCVRTKITVEHFDLLQKVKFKSVQGFQTDEAIAEVSEKQLLDSMYSVTKKGKVQDGIDTYVQLLLAMRYTFLLGLLLRIPGIYHLAKATYNYVAANRTTERCTEDNCGYTLPQIPEDSDQIKLLQNLTFKQLRVGFIMWGMILMTILQGMITVTSDAPLIVMNKIGFMDTAAGKILKRASGNVNGVSKSLLGLTHHTLFMDYHFKGYDHIFNISYVAKDGSITRLPIMDEGGSPSYLIYGTNWAKWTFRVNGPGKQVKQGQFGRGVRDFTAFWAHKQGIKTKDATFVVELKTVEIPAGYVPDLLRKQRALPWETIGTATWNDNQFEMQIDSNYQYLFR